MPYGRMASDRLAGINFDRMRNYRLQRTREAMEKFGIGTLISWDPYSIRYITSGYVTVPTRFPQSQCIVLPRNGDPHCFISTSFSPYALREEMPWLKDKIWPNLFGIKWATKIESLDTHMDKMIPIIQEHGLMNEPVALDGCTKEFLFGMALNKRGIKEVVDGQEMMFDARKIKNKDEIDCIRMACYSADAAFDEMVRAIRPGIRECDLVGIGMKKLYEMGADEVQEFVCASGPRTNPMHIDFTDRSIVPGDLVSIDINGNSYMGYKSCYYRTFCCGRATQEQKEVYEEARAMMYAGMAGVKAGNTTADICAGWPDSPQYWGFDNWADVGGFALGHGLGISLHEAPAMFKLSTLSIRTETLEEGMVIAIETWAGKRGGSFGVRLEEDIVVTRDGYELLTKYPVDELMECGI